VELRAQVVDGERLSSEQAAMRAMARAFSSRRSYERAQRLARAGRRLRRLPGWSATRDLPPVPEQSFRDWWRSR
jgi:L-lactate dehydrogenase complex protein LldF